MFQLNQLFRRFVDEVFHCVLIVQPVATAHGVVEVEVEAVVALDDTRRSTFCGASVAAHRVYLGNEGDAQFRIGFGESDGGSQPRASGTDDGDIGFDYLHNF